MGIVNPSQSTAGEEINAADINNPINQLANVINGNIDQNNIAASGVGTTQLADGAVTGVKMEARPSEYLADFVYSGGVIAQSAGLVGTFSNIVYYISGIRYTKNSVANKTYTASKDTYVDINAAGTVTYTEVANNAASPALTAGNIRLAIVTTNGSAITNVNQGETTKVIPIASSVPYAVTDSLGNLICPRDPRCRILGYRQITSNFNFTSLADVTGLSVPVNIPGSTSRAIAITFNSAGYLSTVLNDIATLSIKEGSTLLQDATYCASGIAGSTFTSPFFRYVGTATPGTHTYKLTAQRVVGTGTNTIGATSSPASLTVELL